MTSSSAEFQTSTWRTSRGTITEPNRRPCPVCNALVRHYTTGVEAHYEGGVIRGVRAYCPGSNTHP